MHIHKKEQAKKAAAAKAAVSIATSRAQPTPNNLIATTITVAHNGTTNEVCLWNT